MKNYKEVVIFTVSTIVSVTIMFAGLYVTTGENPFHYLTVPPSIVVAMSNSDREIEVDEVDEVDEKNVTENITEKNVTEENVAEEIIEENIEDNIEEINPDNFINFRESEENKNLFELPINGATGYSTVSKVLVPEPREPMVTIVEELVEEIVYEVINEEVDGILIETTVEKTVEKVVETLKEVEEIEEIEPIASVVAGQAFTILQEQGEWWLVAYKNSLGWLKHEFCMINVPDILPSMIFDNTNSYSSRFRSLGYAVPNITGEMLYDVESFNIRLDEKMYAMPVMYGTAKKIAQVQEKALSEGNTLVLIESYRPYETQRQIVDNVTTLMNSNSDVNKAIMSWGKTWFISTGISNHQKGIAVDISLAKIIELETQYTGDYKYEKVVEFEEYEMPTTIHELSPASASKEKPVSPNSSAWDNMPNGENMNDMAILLQNYCLSVGLSPLASEWWHFNDFSTSTSSENTGKFGLSVAESLQPIIGVLHEEFLKPSEITSP